MVMNYIARFVIAVYTWLVYAGNDYRVSVRHWSKGSIPTLFIHIWLYTIAIGGFAGNCRPGIHIQWHRMRMLEITIRTGGRYWFDKRKWTPLTETNWYIRLGQKCWDGVSPMSKEEYKTKKVWRVEWASTHFCLLAKRLNDWRIPFVSYHADFSPGGDELGTAKILFISSTNMF